MRDDLGDRMKGYENVSKRFFTRRTPLILRLDGKNFHGYLRPVRGSFHEGVRTAMADTMLHLISEFQNCVFGYTQSDEISLLFNDWGKLTTEAAYKSNQSKLESVAASIATGYFNWNKNHYDLIPEVKAPYAAFDCRTFTIPKEEVANYFVWRQQDATRNSIQMLAQMHFSHKRLQGKNQSALQDMLMLEKGINWNDIETWKKRGICGSRLRLVADTNIPIFTKDRGYIEQHLLTEQEREDRPSDDGDWGTSEDHEGVGVVEGGELSGTG